MIARGTWVVLACAVMGAALPAHAQNSADTEAQALAWLASPNADEVRLGIETLGLVPSNRTATALVERARRGLPGDLLEGAIATLGAMENPIARPLLLELTYDRRASIRAKSLEALGILGGSDAIAAIRRGLDDDDATVRAAAVAGISAANDRASVEVLLRAFDRGVTEAAPVVGRLGTPEQVRLLLGYLGHAPLEAVLPGCAEALGRAELPQRLRLDIVARLTELGTENIRTFFTEVQPNLPGNANDAVQRAVNDAIMRISG